MSKVKFVTVTQTVTSGSAYASGNAIGGVMTFAGLADRGFSTIMSLTVVDKSSQNAACDLFLFNQLPTGTVTDKTAVALSTADLLNCVAVVPIATTDYASGGTNGSVAAKVGKANLFIGVGGSSDNNVYGVLVSRGTPTFTSTSAIAVSIAAEVPIEG